MEFIRLIGSDIYINPQYIMYISKGELTMADGKHFWPDEEDMSNILNSKSK